MYAIRSYYGGGPSTGLPTRVSQGDVRQARNPSHGDYRSITLWPSPATRIKHFTDKVKNVLCVELNIRQYTEEVERVSSRLDIHGLYKVNGRAISPYEIVNKVKEII